MPHGAYIYDYSLAHALPHLMPQFLQQRMSQHLSAMKAPLQQNTIWILLLCMRVILDGICSRLKVAAQHTKAPWLSLVPDLAGCHQGAHTRVQHEICQIFVQKRGLLVQGQALRRELELQINRKGADTSKAVPPSAMEGFTNPFQKTAASVLAWPYAVATGGFLATQSNLKAIHNAWLCTAEGNILHSNEVK